MTCAYKVYQSLPQLVSALGNILKNPVVCLTLPVDTEYEPTYKRVKQEARSPTKYTAMPKVR